MHVQRHLIRAVLPLLLLFTLSAPVAAQAQEPRDPRAQQDIPLYDNYSLSEVVITPLIGAAAATMIIRGHELFGAPKPGLGEPSTESVDYRFSKWANPNPDPSEKLFWGIPDYGAFAAPALLLGFYGAGWIGAEAKDDFALDTRKHEFMAYAGALSWTLLVTNTLKFTFGRTRPFVVRPDVDTSKYDYGEREYHLSFPSGHSSTAAVTATFLALDVSDYLVREVLHDSSPFTRFTVGRLLPYLGATLVTGTVMYSRVRDQKHWLSDTVTGALIGAGFATLFYNMHFDELGNPKRRQASRNGTAAIQNATLMPVVQGPGQFALSYGFVF